MSVSNGILIVETSFEGKTVNEFIIVDKISSIELSISFSNGESEVIKKRIEKYFDEFEEFDKGGNSVADLIECIGNSEEASTLTKYFLDGNHSLYIKVDEYELITNEVSIFYKFKKGEIDTQFNMLLLLNDSINSVIIPELCERLGVNVFKHFRYVKS